MKFASYPYEDGTVTVRLDQVHSIVVTCPSSWTMEIGVPGRWFAIDFGNSREDAETAAATLRDMIEEYA